MLSVTSVSLRNSRSEPKSGRLTWKQLIFKSLITKVRHVFKYSQPSMIEKVKARKKLGASPNVEMCNIIHRLKDCFYLEVKFMFHGTCWMRKGQEHQCELVLEVQLFSNMHFYNSLMKILTATVSCVC